MLASKRAQPTRLLHDAQIACNSDKEYEYSHEDSSASCSNMLEFCFSLVLRSVCSEYIICKS